MTIKIGEPIHGWMVSLKQEKDAVKVVLTCEKGSAEVLEINKVGVVSAISAYDGMRLRNMGLDTIQLNYNNNIHCIRISGYPTDEPKFD